MIIAVTGKKRSGKNAVCDVLASRYGFTVIGFADKLKAMAYDIDPVIYTDSDGVYEDIVHLAELVDKYGWEKVKDLFPEARRFLQRLGTEGVRNHIGQYTWVKLWWDAAEMVLRNDGDVAVPDLRFLSEYRGLTTHPDDWPVQVWRVHRPDLPASTDGHASETEQDAILHNLTLVNSGTLEKLAEQVCWAYEGLPVR